MSKATIQQPASVNEAESKAGFAAPSGSADSQVILRSYAEGCWARFVKSPGEGCNPAWAIQNRDKWVTNCMSDAEKDIAAGRETWARIEAMYRQPRTLKMPKTNRKPKARAGSLERMVRPLPVESLCRHLHTISSIAFIEAGGPPSAINETWEQCPKPVKAAFQAMAKYIRRQWRPNEKVQR